jgi:prepilin-type N-terminal cleavage/methylation domain-containing protein
MRKQSSGFTLTELLVGMAIVSIGLTAAIPNIQRNMKQGEVDRFTQQLETGFFGLRAKLGQQKTSCTLEFKTSDINTFSSPKDLIETSSNPELLKCCDSDIGGCEFSPNIANAIINNFNNQASDSNQPQLTPDEEQKIKRDRTLRILNKEGTAEAQQVEVAVNSEIYELTPPGTSTMANDLLVLIRSTNTTEQRLQTRCLRISGTGSIFRGTWNSNISSCES